MGTDGNDNDRFVRYAQMLFGFCLWGYMLFFDLSSGVELASLSPQELAVKGVFYGFAAILIKGVSVEQLTDLLRAWRGK